MSLTAGRLRMHLLRHWCRCVAGDERVDRNWRRRVGRSEIVQTRIAHRIQCQLTLHFTVRIGFVAAGWLHAHGRRRSGERSLWWRRWWWMRRVILFWRRRRRWTLLDQFRRKGQRRYNRLRPRQRSLLGTGCRFQRQTQSLGLQIVDRLPAARAAGFDFQQLALGLLRQAFRNRFLRYIAPFRMVVLALVAVRAFLTVRTRRRRCAIRTQLSQEAIELGPIASQWVIRRHKPATTIKLTFLIVFTFL